MKSATQLAKPAAALVAAGCAAYLAQSLVRRPSWRGTVAWAVHSWWHPADREARWEQVAGDFIDPWDKIFSGKGAGSRGAGSVQTQPASSLGR